MENLIIQAVSRLMQNSKQKHSFLHELQLRSRADWLLQVGYMTLNLLMKSGLHSHAKAVSYSALPFMLIFVYLINTYLIGYPEVMEAFNAMISFTHLNFLYQSSMENGGRVFSEIPIWLCIVVLLWTSRGLFRSIQGTFEVIFADPGKSRFADRLFPLTVPFVFLIIAFSVLGDHLTDHVDYSFLGMPFLETTLRLFFSLISTTVLALSTWGIAFLLYYLLPRRRPVLSSALLCSLLFILSLLLLISTLGNIMQMDQYSRLYGMLGEFIYVLIWVYLGSILFFFWAEFLYVTKNIDIFVLEKIFIERESMGRLERKIERFLFRRSRRVFAKYGQRFKAGDIILRQNEDSDSIYFLYSGRVGLYREHQGKKSRLSVLKEGEVFGEMAYLLGEKRTATAVAESECFLFILSPATFAEMINCNTSFAARVIESLCQRIAKMNQGNLTSSPSSLTGAHLVFRPEAGEV